MGLYYNHNGTLWLALWDEWQVDEDGYVEDTYQMIKAQEFRFDSGRQRYLTRPMSVDPQDWLEPLPGAVWTDYVGAMPYGDFDVAAGPTVTELRGYLTGGAVGGVAGLGDGLFAHQDAATGEAFYVHGDLISSSVLTTDDSGSAADTLAYTAFGDVLAPGGQVPDSFPRYQYAGGFGYESGLIVLDGALGTPPITLQHVGWRWYQPSIGRFVQRDPVSIFADFNVYAYMSGCPNIGVDPEGLQPGFPICEYCGRLGSHKITCPLYVAPYTGPRRPKAHIIARIYLVVSGGQESWMDNPRRVKQVQVALKIGATVVTWVSPVGKALKFIGRCVSAGGWLPEIRDAFK